MLKKEIIYNVWIIILMLFGFGFFCGYVTAKCLQIKDCNKRVGDCLEIVEAYQKNNIDVRLDSVGK